MTFGRLDSPVTRLNDTKTGFYAVTDDTKYTNYRTDYIAFADDITQITLGNHKFRHIALITKHAIQQISINENK